MKKHIRSNYKNLLINFFAMVLSLFALIGTINIIASENTIYEAIVSTYPNKNVYFISKTGYSDDESGYNIVQTSRPTISEISKLEIFDENYLDIDLSYLLGNYILKVDGLVKNETILFEPHFLDNEIILISGLNYENLELYFEREFQFKEEDTTVYETFKWNTLGFEKKIIKVFNFLRVPTVYYPYKILKNAAETTYFSSYNDNLYEYIKQKSPNDAETNYSLIGVCDEEKMTVVQNSEYAKLYSFANTGKEISNNFMSLFSTILDFCFYFLIAIVLLVVILFLYTIYLMILKNHKEVALLRTFGMSKSSVNFIYRIELWLLFLFSFLVAISFVFLTFFLINKYVVPGLDITFYLNLDVYLTTFLFLLTFIIIAFLVQIPLFKINRINIRKELNSL